MLFVKGTTLATGTIKLPATVQKSAEPLSGKFRILCNTTKGIAYSEEMNWNENSFWIRYKLMRSCPELFDKIEVW